MTDQMHAGLSLHHVTRHIQELKEAIPKDRKAIGRLKQNVQKSLITRIVDGFGAAGSSTTIEEKSDPEMPLLPSPDPAPAPKPPPQPSPNAEPPPEVEPPAEVEPPPELEPPRSKPAFKRMNAASWDDGADLSALAVSDSDGAPCITNPRIWWRHPVMRLAAVWSIIFMDFYIYGEDPVQDSHLNYQFFGVFEDMFIIKWPSETKFRVIRITLFILFSIFSLWWGRWVIHHRLLRDFFGLQMFSGTQGVGVVNFLTWVVTFEYILPYPINYIESGTTSSPLTEDSVLKYYQWGKIWQTTAAVADVLSITMITDTVLQDRTVWPNWAPGLKWLWNDACNGWVRVLAPYLFLGVLLPVIVHGLWTDGKSNGIYTVEQTLTGHLGTTQWMRVLVAALLTMVDITTCLQDWEFPAYSSPADFKVVGTFLTDLDIPIFSNLFKRLFGRCTCISPEFWEAFHFKMSGKWIAYLPAFGALGVDWWYMARTIFPYEPQKFAQYARPEDCLIFTITNATFIDSAYKGGLLQEDMVGEVTYEARKGLEPDHSIHSRFCNDPAWMTYVPFALGIGAGLAFIILVFRAEYYWDRYSDRVDKDEVKQKLDQYHEEAEDVAGGKRSSRPMEDE